MTPWLILVLCSFVAPAFAQSNGMDMSMDVPMNLAVGNMLPYAHFTPGDTVWFPGWVPASSGTMVGTCIGVFLLAILERWLAACLEFAEQHWAERASVLGREKSENALSLPSSSSSKTPTPTSSLPSPGKFERLRLPPFVPEFDITRGVLFAARWSVKVLLMMAVMTFQLSFLLSIATGSGVGETLFGRFLSHGHEHEH